MTRIKILIPGVKKSTRYRDGRFNIGEIVDSNDLTYMSEGTVQKRIASGDFVLIEDVESIPEVVSEMEIMPELPEPEQPEEEREIEMPDEEPEGGVDEDDEEEESPISLERTREGFTASEYWDRYDGTCPECGKKRRSRASLFKCCVS